MRFYKGVIFDFNGTLFFDNSKHILAWSKISQDIRNHGISEEELHEHINVYLIIKLLHICFMDNVQKNR